jgi:hypothetical protein
MKHLFYKMVAIVATMAASSFASAGDLVQPSGGTTADPSATAAKTAALLAIGKISPANTFAAAQYGTGGVALRNRGAGGISAGGVVTPVKAAFAYWAVITNGAPSPAVASIQLQRQFPLPASATVTLKGTVVGTGASPCWGGTAIWVYKASVPAPIVTGNGLYKVTGHYRERGRDSRGLRQRPIWQNFYRRQPGAYLLACPSDSRPWRFRFVGQYKRGRPSRRWPRGNSWYVERRHQAQRRQDSRTWIGRGRQRLGWHQWCPVTAALG